MRLPFLHKLINRCHKRPVLSVPDAYPLSPCIVEPYADNAGKREENKGYVPVSLLMRAIKDHRIFNIAVAGNYGVGKSSVINTAEKKLDRWERFCWRHRFIRISLASLLTKENKDRTGDHNTVSTGGVGSVTEKQIEYSILQQILYHDKPQTAPKSRIHRIHKTKWYKPFLITLLLFVTIVSLVFFIKPSWAIAYITFDNFGENVDNLLKWGPLVVLVVVLFIIVCYLAQHYSFAVDKVGYKDIEMKITKDMSVFNAYLDEIVYFFESTKYDVVVFEDLDRFANKEIIFYKLRELNTILNNSHSFKRKINFVYAISDDLFDATERVKFFDYIVTVIPVINSLNSYEKLKEAIRPSGTFDKLGRTELWNLCDYLQDMRLLLNIVNEFNQFIILLDSKVMSQKVLFGLIVYKNYVPWDFAKMYNKAGVVAGILEDAEEQRKRIVAGYDEKIALLREGIETEKVNLIQKQTALRKRYLEKAKELSRYSAYDLKVRHGEIDYQFDSVAADPSLFQKVRERNAVHFLFNNSNLVQIPSFEMVDNNLVGLGGFDNVMAQYEEDNKRKIGELELTIQSFSQKKKELPYGVDGIYQANTAVLDEKLKALGNLENIQLVKFLILNGYLDRYYQYYLSYFYPNALTREDRNFTMRAARREGHQFEVKLERLDEVIKRFEIEDFSSNESLLNVDLVRAFFGRGNQYQAYRAPVCNLITKNHILDFVLSAYKVQPAVSETFFYSLLREFDFWDEIEQAERTPEEQEIFREIYAKYCDLQEGRINPRFRTWLQDNYSFLEKRWEVITSKRTQSLFVAYSPVFNELSLINTPDLILQDIIENQRFSFTRKNLNAIIRKLGFFKKYRSAAYSAIREDNNQALILAVKAHWPEALKSVFPDTSVHEEVDTQCALLNDPDTPQAEVCRYLSKQRDRIDNPILLKEGVLELVFENSLVAPTWKNVYYYSVTRGRGIPLQFLYNNSFKDRVSDALSPEEESSLARLILFSDKVKITKYSELAPLFTTPFSRIPFQIQLQRMKVLVEKGTLVFNPENYKSLLNHYPSLHTHFLLNNLDSFVLHPEDYPINKSDALAAIQSIPTKKAKIEFIRAIKVQDLVFDATFVAIARKYIEDGDLKVTEIGHQLLLSVISDAPEATRETIGRRVILALDFDVAVITDVLNAIGGEYRRLTTYTEKSTISYSLDAIKICNYLVANSYLAGCEKKNSKIVIYKTKKTL